MATAAQFAFDPVAHIYSRGGVAIPSVTQILEAAGLVCYQGINPATLDRKALIGTAAHAAAFYYDEGDLDESTVAEEVRGYLEAWKKFRKETDFVPRLIEFRGIAKMDGLEYGYTLDRIGTMQGREFLLELKCTAQVEISWGPQTAAYESAQRTIDGTARRRVAVHLRPDGSYRLIELNDLGDYQVFRLALQLEWWKQMKEGVKHGNADNGNR